MEAICGVGMTDCHVRAKQVPIKEVITQHNQVHRIRLVVQLIWWQLIKKTQGRVSHLELVDSLCNIYSSSASNIHNSTAVRQQKRKASFSKFCRLCSRSKGLWCFILGISKRVVWYLSYHWADKCETLWSCSIQCTACGTKTVELDSSKKIVPKDMNFKTPLNQTYDDDDRHKCIEDLEAMFARLEVKLNSFIKMQYDSCEHNMDQLIEEMESTVARVQVKRQLDPVAENVQSFIQRSLEQLTMSDNKDSSGGDLRSVDFEIFGYVQGAQSLCTPAPRRL
ncbi:hypothetical protein P4O66_012606 [Electrophorus voltai]|uniref:Uncharacterized protein n=1 Tax=Electrophorus voltai TaxID=2609070 RepID=A0AAD8Z793_9TELE|nr:hypothetical protein P4O66_012606 [Electrophorus voltai]